MQQKYQRIYKVITLVPQGKVASYGQIADLSGLPGRARLVGRALKHLATNSHIAWHRIVKSSGQIAFPAGSEKAQLQQNMLQEEQVVVLKNRVSMKEFQWHPDLHILLHELNF